MNYKYIEQLIERYFAAETSVAEERILRAFFTEAECNVPSHFAAIHFSFPLRSRRV